MENNNTMPQKSENIESLCSVHKFTPVYVEGLSFVIVSQIQTAPMSTSERDRRTNLPSYQP